MQLLNNRTRITDTDRYVIRFPYTVIALHPLLRQSYLANRMGNCTFKVHVSRGVCREKIFALKIFRHFHFPHSTHKYIFANIPIYISLSLSYPPIVHHSGKNHSRYRNIWDGWRIYASSIHWWHFLPK